MPPPRAYQTVLLCAVHFNDAPRVLAFAEHVLSHERPDGWTIEVALADNSVSWNHGSPPIEGMSIYTPPDNLGYLSGCAFAFEQWCSERCQPPDWVAVVNSDITFEPGFFTRLLTHPLDPAVGVVAPDIRLPDGTQQNPFMRTRPSRGKMLFYLTLFRFAWLHSFYSGLYLLKRSINHCRMKPPAAQGEGTLEHGKPEVIYAPHGSAMFMSRSFLERGGTLDYAGIMYGEETHIAEQVRRLNLTVMWIPGLCISHEGASSTSRQTRNRVRVWQYDSARINWRNYYSLRASRGTRQPGEDR